MAMPARKLEWETPVEDRLGKIEAHIEHMRSDISDLKVDVRRLNEKVDEVERALRLRFPSIKRVIGHAEPRMPA